MNSVRPNSSSQGERRRTNIMTVTPPNEKKQGASRPAFFLDRDGVLIEEVGYLSDPKRVVILPTVIEAITNIVSAGFGCCVITNQAGLARGYFGLETVLAIHNRFDELISPHAQDIAGFYVCPHHPEGTVEPWNRPCKCRKPNPGMLQQAAAENGFDLSRSFMIGDKLIDLQAGAAAGCSTALVRTGYGGDHEASVRKEATPLKLVEVADSLLSAVTSCLAVATSH